MPAPVLLIPLLSAEAGTVLMGTLGAGIAGFLAGNAIKNTLNGPAAGPSLTMQSSPQQFSTATSNYLKAEQEREALKAKGLGGLPLTDATKEIAQKYDYVEVNDKGTLAVAADQTLVEGGPLQLQENNGTVTLANSNINLEVPYENYGTNDYPLAVTPNTPVNTVLSEDAGTPYIKNDGVIVGDAQFVAQQAILSEQAAGGIGEDLQSANDYPVGIGSDIIDSQNTPVAVPQQQIQDQLGTVPTAADLVDPALEAELAREAARGGSRGYVEDAGNVSDSGSVSQAGTIEQARALERADAEALSNAAPGTPLPPPTNTGFRPGGTDTVDPGVNSQATPKLSTGGVVNRNVDYPKESPNPLHAYVNYTYNIAWYAVPRAIMNQITTGMISPGGEDAIIAQSELILKSGGSSSKDKGKYFGVDFFIDNLVLKSIVGQSARNRSTDVVDISFDVIEPYTTTLLPRLIATAYAQTGKPDWGANFYILKIQFLGYDEEGKPTNIPKTTKYIPISLVNMEYEVNERGAVYKIKAIPCNHMAQTLLDNVIPFHMEISGGTVDEIFSAKSQVTGSSATSTNSSTNPDRATGEATGGSTAATGAKQGPQTFKKGVADAINELEKYLVQQGKQNYANVYKFRFEDGIGSKKVVDPQNWRALGFRMSDPKNPNELVGKTIKLDKDATSFRVQSGTRITDLISSVLQVSEFMSEQFATPTPKDKPLYSFKIIPEIKFGDYDEKTNMWQREVTFVIIPYTIFGQDVEGFGQKAPPGATKRFKYIFTGANKDVLNVKIDFKAAFYTLRQAATDAILQDEGDDSRRVADNLKMGIFPQRVKNVMGLADVSNTGPKMQNEKTLNVQQLFKKQFDSVADNLRLDITIVGDPDLIQQDNVMYGAKGDKGKFQYDYGSLNYTSYEAYFYFQMVYPASDYDDNKGLFNVNDQSSEHFNGLYKILSVTTEFRGGKFTQKLENYRVKNQSNQDQGASTGRSAGPVAEKATSTLIVQDDSTGVDAAVARNAEDTLQRNVALDRAEQAIQPTQTNTTQSNTIVPVGDAQAQQVTSPGFVNGA